MCISGTRHLWSCFIDRILPFTGGYRLEGYGEKIQSGGEDATRAHSGGRGCKLGGIQAGMTTSWQGNMLRVRRLGRI